MHRKTIQEINRLIHISAHGDNYVTGMYDNACFRADVVGEDAAIEVRVTANGRSFTRTELGEIASRCAGYLNRNRPRISDVRVYTK